MPEKTMTTHERIDTEIAEVRLAAPPNRARTVFVPADGATVNEVVRKAAMVGLYAVGYDVFSVRNINGRAMKSDGTLRDERMPNWSPSRRLEACL